MDPITVSNTTYLVVVAVARFVKYTGYGNAAGLLAQRGLLCGGSGAEYSSESDDSETEEYSQLRDRYDHGSRRLLATLEAKTKPISSDANQLHGPPLHHFIILS